MSVSPADMIELLNEPRLLIIDEPSVGLAPLISMRRRMTA